MYNLGKIYKILLQDTTFKYINLSNAKKYFLDILSILFLLLEQLYYFLGVGKKLINRENACQENNNLLKIVCFVQKLITQLMMN